MSVIHFHHSIKPDAGDTRRVRNINKCVCDRLSSKKIEVVTYGWRLRKIVESIPFFTLSENTYKKYSFPIIYRIKWIGELTSSLLLAYICKKHKAKYIVAEFAYSSSSLRLIRLVSPKTRIITDFHSVQPEEMIYNDPNMSKSLYKYYEKQDRQACKISDCIICQSDEMRQHLISKYNADGGKIAVYKCGVNTKHFDIKTKEEKTALRSELGIAEKDIVFVYAGGITKWQKIEESLKVFKKYNVYNPNSKFLVLTGDSDKLKEILNNKEWNTIKDSVITTSVPYAEVPNYLNVADIAFLIRDNVVLNAVASPTKLAEYFACGLPIITASVARKWVKPKIEESMIFYDEVSDINSAIDNVIKNRNAETIRQYAVDNLSVEIDEQNIETILNKIFGI